MKRNSILGLGLGAVLSFGILTVGCGSSSTDNTNTNTNTNTSTTLATGGTTTVATGGTTTAATGGTTTAATGGTTTAATGGTTTAATGGTTTPTGGTTTTVPGTLCTTQAKNGTCTTEGETCNKTCGPNKTGYKSETCTSAVYVEGPCTFPVADYACYKVTDATAACPTGTKSGDACTGECAPCSGYIDSNGATKVGYCICVKDKYTCGSAPKEWPCTTSGTPTTAGGTGC